MARAFFVIAQSNFRHAMFYIVVAITKYALDIVH